MSPRQLYEPPGAHISHMTSASIGNIDFTFGKERLAEIAKNNELSASFKLLASNVVDEKNNKEE